MMKKSIFLLVCFLCASAGYGDLLKRAELHRKNGKHALALEHYQKKIAEGGTEKEIFWSLYCVGLMEEALNKPQEKAIESYYKAFQHSPFRVEPICRIANLYLRKKQPLMGYVLCKHALSLPASPEPLYTDPEVNQYHLFLTYADCATELGKYLEATVFYRHILGQNNLPQKIADLAKEKLLTTEAKNSYDNRAFEGEKEFESYDEKRLDLMARFLPKNPVIFEAGAHYGNDTLRFVEKWPEGKFLCFEPNPYAYEKLVGQTKHLLSVQKYNLAVGVQDGKAILHIPYNPQNQEVPLWQTGASSLLNPAYYLMNLRDQCQVEVSCVALDSWCEKNKIEKIDMMWLDLEGFELPALQHSVQTLKNVNLIYTETNFQEMREGMTQYAALKEFLEDAGFRMIAHWYAKNMQGDAIFVKKEIFDKMK